MWPATLVLVWRFVPLSRQATLIALIAVTVLLVAVCIVWTHYDAKAAFYLPFTRLWEFTLGALVLALPEIKRPRVADGLSVAGLAAMLTAALTFNDGLAYPGYYALLPCRSRLAKGASSAKFCRFHPACLSARSPTHSISGTGRFSCTTLSTRRTRPRHRRSWR
jgi:hypothetical protein